LLIQIVAALIEAGETDLMLPSLGTWPCPRRDRR